MPFSARPVRAASGILTLLAIACGFTLAPQGSPAAATTLPAAPSTEATLQPTAERPPLFHEDFENASDNGPGTSVREYLGRADARFEADDFWANRWWCNGIILSAANVEMAPGDCRGSTVAYTRVRALAGALGIVNGTDPKTNSVVAAYTEGSGPDGAIELETTTPIVLEGSTGRFLTASVNVSALNCFAATPPALRFSLATSDGIEHPVSGAPIDPCSDERATDISSDGFSVRAGHFAADSSLLIDGDQVRVVMRNEHGNGSGNDHAFDDLRVIDATPTVDVEVTTPATLVGERALLRFTVRNTPDLAAKDGWSMTTQLPEGLRASSTAQRIASSCATTDVSAHGGRTSITIDGSLAADTVACTVDVEVSAATRGALAISPTEDTVLRGLDAGSTGTLTVVEPVSISTPGSDELVESTLPVFGGTGEPGATVVLLDAEDDPVCEATVTDEGEWACVATTELLTGPALIRAGQSAHGTTSTTETNYRILAPTPQLEGIVQLEARSAHGAWRPAGDSLAAVVGDEVRVVATLTNTGNMPLGELAVRESPSSALQCTSDVIEPGASVECSSTSSIGLRSTDLDHGKLVHEFEAVGIVLSTTEQSTISPARRLPIPDRPIVSTGLISTELGLVWRVAPLDQHSPLARTGTDQLESALWIIAATVLSGAALLTLSRLRRRTGQRSSGN